MLLCMFNKAVNRSYPIILYRFLSLRCIFYRYILFSHIKFDTRLCTYNIYILFYYYCRVHSSKRRLIEQYKVNWNTKRIWFNISFILFNKKKIENTKHKIQNYNNNTHYVDYSSESSSSFVIIDRTSAVHITYILFITYMWCFNNTIMDRFVWYPSTKAYNRTICELHKGQDLTSRLLRMDRIYYNNS